MASESGPTLPRYIVQMTTTFDKEPSDEVKPLESPTVAQALTASYTISRVLPPEKAESKREDKNAMESDVEPIAIALFKTLCEMDLLKTVTSLFCLTEEITDAAITATVTVLMPPAVPTGEPPIIIRKIETRAEAPVKFS